MKKITSGALMAAALLMGAQALAADLKIEIKGIRNSQAPIYLTLWDKPQDFLHTAGRKVTIAAQSPSAFAVVTDLPPGEYSVALYQDLNGNKKLDTNFIGIPKEPSAISNDAVGKFGPPVYDDAKFTLGKEGRQIVLTLHD